MCCPSRRACDHLPRPQGRAGPLPDRQKRLAEAASGAHTKFSHKSLEGHSVLSLHLIGFTPFRAKEITGKPLRRSGKPAFCAVKEITLLTIRQTAIH
jgi:hypothetical protein